MYTNIKNNCFHGIMFHHFHDSKRYLMGQGSIDRNQFKKIINFIGRKNIINASEFIERYKNKKLKKNHVCITFDDSLKCQIDIALPVLEDYKIKAFFFVYSSIFYKNKELLEIYRFFRHNYYPSINKFYEEFFNSLPKNKKQKLNNFFNLKKKIINKKLKRYKFYSEEDVKFRLVRDYFLSQEVYKKTMKKLFKQNRK